MDWLLILVPLPTDIIKVRRFNVDLLQKQPDACLI